MAATREDVDRWIKTAKKMKAKYIVSVCDTFDYDDYPVYVMPSENLENVKSAHSINMQRVNEVITINSDGSVIEGR